MAYSWPEHFPRASVRQVAKGGRLTCLCLALEAWRRGLRVTWTDPALRHCTITGADGTVRFLHSLPQTLTPDEDDDRLIDKWATKRRLEEHGVPVPAGRLIEPGGVSDDELDAHASAIGFPLVAKPHDGTMGRGVFTGIQSPDDLRRYVAHIAQAHPASSILLEEHVVGDDYRVLVIGGSVAAAIRRIPANVVGDGVATVTELIAAKNAHRRLNPFLSTGRIRIDLEVESVLKDHGLDADSVPEDGRTVALRRAANASAGGDVVDVTDDLPEAMRAAAIEATAAMPNIHVAGVDFLFDPSEPDGYRIIELNSRPHIGVHMYPTEGQGRDVPRMMIDHFFPSSSRSGRPGDPLLTMDLTVARRLLGSGAVAEVVVAPLPEHGYPVRRTWRLPRTPERPFAPIEAARIVRAAKSLDVAGRIRRDADGGLFVDCAAETDDVCRGFVDRVVELVPHIVGTVRPHVLDSPARWTGAVAMGFTIPDALVR